MKRMGRNVTKLTFALTLLTGVIACGKQNNHSSVMADPKIQKSFSAMPAAGHSDLHLDQEHIQIQKSALEKEFLLQASIIDQPTAAMGHGLKSRIVTFRHRGNKVYMLEANQGNSVTTDLPQNLVLAEMNIIKETTDSIVIDFNKGMSVLLVAGEWRASDHEKSEYSAEENFESIPLRFSYIENAKIETNHLEIRQIAQAVATDGKASPIEIKYYLSPYLPDKNFVPSKSVGNFERFGFFEAAPLQQFNNDDVTHVTKFNTSKDIVYAISANTPAEYKEAVRDGVLYWNQAFGSNAVKVIDAPLGVTAPHINYNVIQWVKYDNAGFAYADAQVDPRTGETLHAQVYFTSVFALSGKKSARAAIAEWDKKQKSSSKTSKTHFSLKGFSTEPLCAFSQTENFVNNLRDLVANQVDDAKILKASQDYIREVVAHEIGHTLGLRHNFAGSLAANYNVSERATLNKKYYETGAAAENIIPSSSVMDYQLFEESTWTGDIIAKKTRGLKHDVMAIQTLYLGKDFNDAEYPLYCTDSHTLNFADCKRFDAGRSFIEATALQEGTSLRAMSLRLLNRFIYAKSPSIGETPMSLQKVILPETDSFVAPLSIKAIAAMNTFSESFKLISNFRAYPFVDSTNLPIIKEDQLNYMQSQINAIGGMSEMLKGDGGLDLNQAQDTFKKVLDENKKGIGFGEQVYEFSEEEMALINRRVNDYFSVLSKDMITYHSNVLNGKVVMNKETIDFGILPNHEVSEDLAQAMLKKAEMLILDESGEKINVEIKIKEEKDATKSIMVSLPKYKYSYDVRKNAARFLNSSRSKSVVWGLLERKKLIRELKKRTKDILSVELTNLKAEEMPTIKAAQWLKENQNILNAIE